MTSQGTLGLFQASGQADQHAFSCTRSCLFFPWSLVGVQQVSSGQRTIIVATFSIVWRMYTENSTDLLDAPSGGHGDKPAAVAAGVAIARVASACVRAK
eukprot:1577305-Pleurochrysis_carterae.AAC.3